MNSIKNDLKKVMCKDRRSMKDHRVADGNMLIGTDRRYNNRRSGIERRQHKRFQVKNGAYAVFMTNPPKLAQIKEISKGGLMVRYFDSGDMLDETSELDILMKDTDFRIRKVPFRTTSNFTITVELSESSIMMRQTGMKFREMKPNQISELDHFIKII